MSKDAKNLTNKPVEHIPNPKPDIGIDTDNTFGENIIGAAINSILNISSLNSFSNVAQTRETMYRVIDEMASDSTIASVIEAYAEDVTETNDKGQIVWCESNDANVGKLVDYLLTALRVDKNIYSWALSLVKYGDVYLRMYRESDCSNSILFTQDDIAKDLEKLNDKSVLNEDVNIVLTKPNDHYIHYLEKIDNPAEMFELTDMGKTVAYVQAPVMVQNAQMNDYYGNQQFNGWYNINKQDVNIYSATSFVHATLSENSNRVAEKVNIYMNDSGTNVSEEYTVKRGQSLLYNTYPTWRELSLLENSAMLSRITKSSVIRMILVEIGDMPKEQVGPYLQQIKRLMEQKQSIDTGKSMQEYPNPGPVENNIYIPKHGDNGNIAVETVGGDFDPKQLTDLDWWNNKLFASLRVPKAYFGWTDDGAGFNGGTSLSIISSRYGKSVKRVQNALLQMLTDAINMYCIDKGLSSYVGKFTLRMQAPITQEELDRRANNDTRLRYIQDIMNNMPEIENPIIKLKMFKTLITSVVNDSDFIGLIQAQIDELEAKAKNGENIEKEASTETTTTTKEKEESPRVQERDLNDFEKEILTPEELPTEEETQEIEQEESDYIPTPNELGVSMAEEQ